MTCVLCMRAKRVSVCLTYSKAALLRVLVEVAAAWQTQAYHTSVSYNTKVTQDSCSPLEDSMHSILTYFCTACLYCSIGVHPGCSEPRPHGGNAAAVLHPDHLPHPVWLHDPCTSGACVLVRTALESWLQCSSTHPHAQPSPSLCGMSCCCQEYAVLCMTLFN
jgi:hypothetical protein